MFQREYLPAAVSPEVLSENGRSIPEQLAALHLATPDGVPNVAALLDGAEITDPILDRKELTGPLPEVLRRMDYIAEAHIRVPTTVLGGTVESVRPDYPLGALQQLLRNAVIHRN